MPRLPTLEARGRGPWRWILALGALLYLPCLGRWELSYPDEPDVVEPVRAMLATDDWVTPRHGEIAWIDYPPLVFWAQALSCEALGGLTRYAHRLPSALAAIGLALVVLAFGRRRLGPVPGLVAAVVLLTMPQFAWQAVNAHPDMLFAAFQGVGLLLYAAAERWRPGAAWAARVGAFACFGAAVLAKGPLGLLLPGLVLTLWHASYGQWGRVLLLAPLALVAVAVAAPWYVALAQAQGWELVKSEVLLQNVGRFRAGSGRGHERPAYYYLERVVPDLGAWVLLWLPFHALGRGLLWADPMRRLLTIWVGATLVLLTLAATKRGVYLLSAYPAVALLLGELFARVMAATRDASSRPARDTRTLARVATWIVAPLALALLAVPFALRWLVERTHGPDDPAREPMLGLGPAAVTAAVVLAASLPLLRRAAHTRAFAWMAAATALLHAGLFLVAVALVVPRFDPTWSYRALGEDLRAHTPPGEPVGFLAPGFEIRRRAAVLYFSERPLRYLASPDDLRAFLAEEPGRAAVVGGTLARVVEQDVGLAAQVTGSHHISNTPWLVLASPAR
jgi:4-amino-4-deoxy-L-arabinose transferase-like glycosyltransferase